MEQRACEHIHPGIITIQAMLRKIDRLRLPLASRHDVERILVRQVTNELDRALPWQAGHGRRTAMIALLIGQVLGLPPYELHELQLASFLHDIGLLMLPHNLITRANRLDSESYITMQNHPRLGATLLEPFFSSEPLLFSSPTITSDGTGRAIPMESEAPSSLLEPGFLPSPTPSMRSTCPKQILPSATGLHSEFSSWHPALSSI